MPVGGKDVIDYVNTTSGVARQVIADNDISGNGVEVRFTNAPGTFSYIVTEADDNITTEGGDLLITQS